MDNVTIEYQDYLETKEKVEHWMEKVGSRNIEEYKAWLRIQNMRVFEIEEYEKKHNIK